MKQLFSTHKRYMLVFDFSTFRRGGQRNGLNSLDAMICLAMCYYHFEDFFHVFISIQTMGGIRFQNIKSLFEQNLDFFLIRDELNEVWAFLLITSLSITIKF